MGRRASCLESNGGDSMSHGLGWYGCVVANVQTRLRIGERQAQRLKHAADAIHQ